jgi:hypothetical protein
MCEWIINQTPKARGGLARIREALVPETEAFSRI